MENQEILMNRSNASEDDICVLFEKLYITETKNFVKKVDYFYIHSYLDNVKIIIKNGIS